MKKHLILAAWTLLTVFATLSFTSCDDDNDDWFSIDDALIAYFQQYGIFGADDQTTAQWFDIHYPQMSDEAYNQFLKGVSDNVVTLREVEEKYIDQFGEWGTNETDSRVWLKQMYRFVTDDNFNYFWQDFLSYVSESQQLMAKYLVGGWSGQMTRRYRDSSGENVTDNCQVTWEFEYAANSYTNGRGREVRVSGGNTVENRFSWAVNDLGGIEMSYDNPDDSANPWNLIVEYSSLDELNATHFQGTLVGLNVDEQDDFNLTKASYAKGASFMPTRSANIDRVFKGRDQAKAVKVRVAKGTQQIRLVGGRR